MCYASWAIAIACSVLWVGRHEQLAETPLRRLSSVHLTVDGNSVVGGPFSEGLRPWVLVTALFHHASRSHIVNNMLMLLATGGELEAGIGSLPLLGVFIGAGVVGWLATLLYYKIVLAEAWAGGIAQMQPSVGSSPGTYGLAVFAAVVLPPDTGVGAALWLSGAKFSNKFLFYNVLWTIKCYYYYHYHYYYYSPARRKFTQVRTG